MAKPELTEAILRNYFAPTTLQKGRAYMRDGATLFPRLQGMQLKSLCQGSEPQPYRVELTLSDKGIASGACACPVGGGGRCKHAAALALNYLHFPELFLTASALRERLESRTKEELIALVERMLDNSPQLRPLVDLPSPTHSEPLSREALERLLPAGREAALEQAEAYLEAGNFEHAVTVYEVVLTHLLENFDEHDDYDADGEMIDSINDVAEEVADTLGLIREAALRQRLLELLFSVMRTELTEGGVGIGARVPKLFMREATESERQLIANWLRDLIAGAARWAERDLRLFLLELEGDKDDEAFLKLQREAGRTKEVIKRLLERERYEEALAEARTLKGHLLVDLVELFKTHGQLEPFYCLSRILGKGIADTRLLWWQRNYLLNDNRQGEALEVTEALFWAQPALEHYHLLRQLAQTLNTWETLESTLLARLEREGRGILIAIHLEEARPEAALKQYERLPQEGRIYRLPLASALTQTLPERALDFYLEEVEAIASSQSRPRYAEAAEYLKAIRDLYHRLEQEARWHDFFDSFTQKYRTLRALKAEMQDAGLLA